MASTMDFIGLVTAFREAGISNSALLGKLGFAPRESQGAIDALQVQQIAASVSTLGQYINPSKLYAALSELSLDHFGMLSTVCTTSLVVLPMGMLVVNESRRSAINGVPPRVMMMIFHTLLHPRRKRLQALQNFDEGSVAAAIKRARKILVLTGAGISTSCGIPDFRSPGGIYSIVGETYPELVKTPEKIFSIDYFRQNVKPFFEFNANMVQGVTTGRYKPSICHRFIAELERQGKLQRQYTQNIDGLESVAGVTKYVACHGNFATVTCTRSGVCGTKAQNADLAKAAVLAGKIPFCPKCAAFPPPSMNRDLADGTSQNVCELYDKGVLKHDIVMFGEALPERFFAHVEDDCEAADLIIVIGTSLKVGPVNTLIDKVNPDVPQILINREVVAPGHRFDVELLGDCDAVVQALLQQLKWDVEGLSDLDPAHATYSRSSHQSAPHRWIFINGKDAGHSDTDSDNDDGEEAEQGGARGADAKSSAGKEFLAHNAQKAGWAVLDSGLQYKVLKSGPRPGPSPLANTPCACHYVGRTIAGVEFDSSLQSGQPSTFAPNQVIAGWKQAMQLMVEGDKWELVIPSELAYGQQQRGEHITPGSVLQFTLEIVKVQGEAKQLS